MRGGSAPAGSTAEARSLKEQLEKIAAGRPAFTQPLPTGADKGARWATPQLVADIQFRGWSTDGLLLRASFKGIREDKSADEVVLEAKAKRRSATKAAGLAGVTLTHPDRLLWDEGVTKQALAEFYAEIADWILPHVAGRVLSVVRAPLGCPGQEFLRQAPLGRAQSCARDRRRREGAHESRSTISPADQSGAGRRGRDPSLGLARRRPRAARPPDLRSRPCEDVGWSDVITAARAMRAELEARGLEKLRQDVGRQGIARRGADRAACRLGRRESVHAKRRRKQ